MEIKLLNYKGRKSWIEIPDTEFIRVKVISGDMVLVEPIHFDTGEGERIFDFFDGEVIINKENFDSFNKLTSSSDLWKN